MKAEQIAGRENLTDIQYQTIASVDNFNYKIVAFGPSQGFKLAARLMKFVGEPVAAMASAAGNEAKALEVIPLAVKALCSNLDEDSVLSLIKELLTSVVYQNKQINFEEHFQGRLGHMMKVVGKVVEFQFKDFFTELGDSFASAMSKPK